MALKLGSEKKGEVIALVVLVGVAAGVLWHTFAPGAAAPAAPALAASVAPGVRSATNLNPTLHLGELDALRKLDYNGNGRDLFHFGAAPPPQPAAGRPGVAGRGRGSEGPAPPPAPVLPPRPPPPPSVPLRFYGYADPTSGAEKIFLQMGEDVYVVSEGDTVDKRYLIEKITKTSVRIKDLQTQSEQDVPLQG